MKKRLYVRRALRNRRYWNSLSHPVETPVIAAPAATPTPAAGKDAGSDGWKAKFERSLLEDYGVTPDHYEDLGNGIYQVYVKIDGKVVPYVTVDSATGDYHG